ncbi:MAG: hypothetical protein IKS41_02110 [Alphaproteobacteria bacterium]|nr:hypothetical protein [Alphaproteobacteria bacterium]
MKKTKLVSMFMSLITVSSAFATIYYGESRKEYEQRNAKIDATLPQSLTLVGKRIIDKTDHKGVDESEARLYFDTDGNTNTTEVVAIKGIGCLTAEARVFDAKIGEKKKISEWRKQLSHKNEDACTSHNPSYGSREKHDFYWELVKE